MKKIILAVMLLIPPVAMAQSTGTVTGSTDTYIEAVGMVQSSPTFVCEGRVLLTSGGKITLLELKMSASRVITGAIVSQDGVEKTPAVIIADYLVAQRAITPTVWLTPDQLIGQCEAQAVENDWRYILTARIRTRIDDLPN